MGYVTMQEHDTIETPPTDRGHVQAMNTPSVSASTEPVTFSLAREVVVKSLPRSTTAESIHALRTHLVARHIQEGRRGIAICETDQSGGTFLAANLAISLAEAGIRTLLVDTHMRAPELENYITPSRALPGLADAIEADDVPLGHAIQAVLPNLSLLFAGTGRESSLDLLGSARFAQIVDLCMREYDFTIAATAPLNRYADGRRVASVLRYALVVARKNVTFTADVNTLISELISDQVNVIGSVYNDF